MAPSLPPTAATTLAEISYLAHRMRAPFVYGSSLLPTDPITLRLADGLTVPLTLKTPPEAVAALAARCAEAPVGLGAETLYLPSVRRALQLPARDLAVEGIRLTLRRALAAIRRRLTPEEEAPLRAELYNLNVYEAGGYFKVHKDTPRGEDMLGSLVLCLPSPFRGGRLHLRHQGEERSFDWGADLAAQSEPGRIHYAAFFGDVDHWIDPVEEGRRVTLTYLLRRGGSQELDVDELDIEEDEDFPTREETLRETATELARCLSAALAREDFLPEGAVLASPCLHLYSNQTLAADALAPLTDEGAGALKGRDRVLADAARAAGLQVTVRPYLTESFSDQVWQLREFPPPKIGPRLGREVDPKRVAQVLPVLAEAAQAERMPLLWLLEPPRASSDLIDEGFAYGEDHCFEERDAPRATAARLHLAEFSPTSYFGNESADSVFYVYTVLHLAIPTLARRRGQAEPAKESAAKESAAKPRRRAGKGGGPSKT